VLFFPPGAPSQCFARWPRSPTPCQAATGYKLLQNWSNHTKMLQNLPHGKKTLYILSNATKILQDLQKGGKALGVPHPKNPPVCPSMVSSESMPVNREETLSTQNQTRSSTARPNIFTQKAASERKSSVVGCNFRVFQGIFPEAKKLQGFSGSSRVSRVCWPPCLCWS